MDDNCYVILGSLDLSAAFDIVNVELLLKRLTILGLPMDIVIFKKALFGVIELALLPSLDYGSVVITTGPSQSP